jgi:hypothetical protein
MDTSDKLRTVRFSPYKKGCGPTFTLDTYYLGGDKIGYCLKMRENNKNIILFQGEDFRPSPLYAIDSDESIGSLMMFLTLRPGDTDSDYFKDYTAKQLDYCNKHAESLCCENISRFGEDL